MSYPARAEGLVNMVNSYGTLTYRQIINLAQKIRPYNNNQQQQQEKKKTCKIVDFAIPSDHRIKLKECEKKNKFIDFARELKKKLWNMKVTIISIVIGAFSTVTKGLSKGLED